MREMHRISGTSFVLLTIATFLVQPSDGAQHCENVTSPTDIILVVDRSNSISITDFKELQKFLGSFINEVKTNITRVSLLTYGADVTPEFFLRDNDRLSAQQMNDIIKGINRRQRNGSQTYTYDALKTVRESFIQDLQDYSRHIVILFTDGESNGRRDAQLETIRQASLLKEAVPDATVYAVGIGSQIGIEELIGVSTDGMINSTVFLVANYAVLQATMDASMMKNICILDQTPCIIRPTTADVLFVPYSSSPTLYRVAVRLLQHLNPVGDQLRFGVTSHCDLPGTEITLETSKEVQNNTVQQILSDLGTRVPKGVKEMAVKLKSAPPRADNSSVEERVAVVLIDSLLSPEELKEMVELAEQANKTGITVIPIGVGFGDTSPIDVTDMLTKISNAGGYDGLPIFYPTHDLQELLRDGGLGQASAFHWLYERAFRRICPN